MPELTDTEKVIEFASRVRQAHEELFGNMGLDEQPYTLGPLIVAIAIDYLDGSSDYIQIRSAPQAYALGLARQLVADYLDI